MNTRTIKRYTSAGKQCWSTRRWSVSAAAPSAAAPLDTASGGTTTRTVTGRGRASLQVPGRGEPYLVLLARLQLDARLRASDLLDSVAEPVALFVASRFVFAGDELRAVLGELRDMQGLGR